MQTLFRKMGVYTLCACFILTGCVTDGGFGGGSVGGGPNVGPKSSSALVVKETQAAPVILKPRLDIVVPVFDPGLSDDAKNYKEEGIWPELRRAEANRFAVKLKTALEETNAFGAVRVTPDSTATGDLYVLGTIEESNGEEVEIEIQVVDISGRTWFTRSFDHTVEPGFHKNTRNEGKDPYDPVFEKAAARVVEALQDHPDDELVTLTRITQLRFGSNFTEEAFTQHLLVKGSTYNLRSFPAEDDPMLRRTQAVRVRDQLFVDGLQDHYRTFSDSMQDSYLIWQEQSLLELQAQQEAREKAIGQAALGILTIGLGVLAVIAGGRSDSTAGQTAGVTGGVVAGTVGATLLQGAFHTSAEAKVHREALEELGQSIDIDLAPQVQAFEEQTVELTGDAKEQFAQWRAFLQKIFEEEKTPPVQL